MERFEKKRKRKIKERVDWGVGAVNGKEIMGNLGFCFENFIGN